MSAARAHPTDTATSIETFPGSPFRLHRTFLPAGDQPEAIGQLCAGIESGLM